MKLTVLGKYGPFPRVGGGTSSFLLESEGQRVLLDAGSGSFGRLLNFCAPTSLSCVVISHFHGDHSADLGVLQYALEQAYTLGDLKAPVELFVPCGENPAYEPLLRSPAFCVHFVDEKTVASVGALTLSFVPCQHPVPCFGVCIANGERTLYYTADSRWNEKIAEAAKEADCILANAAFPHSALTEKTPQLSARQAVMLGGDGKKKVFLSHPRPDFEEEIATEVKTLSERAILVCEMETYEL